MTERLLLIGSLLASLTAFAAFVLTVTKTARLRRREQTLRETMAVFAEDGPHHAMLADLHKAVVADLVGRQLTAPWRVIWPWLAWLTVFVLNAQSGFLGARYLAQESEESWTGFATASLGDPTLVPVYPLLMVAILSSIFVGQVYTLMGRAEVTRRFYDGDPVGRPETYSEASAAAEFRSWQTAQEKKPKRGGDPAPPKPPRSRRERVRSVVSGAQMLLLSTLPGVFVVFMGYFIGINLWLSDAGRGSSSFKSIEPLGSIVLVGVSLSATAMVWVWSEVHLALQEHALPTATAPKSKLILPERLRSRSKGAGRTVQSDGG